MQAFVLTLTIADQDSYTVGPFKSITDAQNAAAELFLLYGSRHLRLASSCRYSIEEIIPFDRAKDELS